MHVVNSMLTMCMHACYFHQLTVLNNVKPTGKEIGRGAYGRVFEVKYGKTQYAAKEMHAVLVQYAQEEERQKLKANFLKECHMWGLLHHPRIVQVIGEIHNNA